MASNQNDMERMTFVPAGDSTLIFHDAPQFMQDHGILAMRVNVHQVLYLVYDEDGTLVWVEDGDLERQTTADIKVVNNKRSS